MTDWHHVGIRFGTHSKNGVDCVHQCSPILQKLGEKGKMANCGFSLFWSYAFPDVVSKKVGIDGCFVQTSTSWPTTNIVEHVGYESRTEGFKYGTERHICFCLFA